MAGHRDLNDARQEREVASTSRSGAAPQDRLRRARWDGVEFVAAAKALKVDLVKLFTRFVWAC